jgi:GT2 family glycosyltransferase
VVAPDPRVLKDYFAFCLCHLGRGMWSSAVVARRDILLRIGGFPAERRMGEDLDTWCRLAWSGPIGYIPHVLAVYHYCANACSRSLGASEGNQCEVYCDIFETYMAWSSSGLVSTALARSSAAQVYLFRFYEAYRAICLGQADRVRDLYAGLPLRQRLSAMGLFGYLARGIPWCRRPFLGLGRRIGRRILAHRWRERQ